MKIISNGFRITDICPQIDGIEVDGEQMVRIAFVLQNNAQYTSRMSVSEFNAFAEAVLAARDGLKADPTPPEATRPQTVIDRQGDEWVWRDDHNGYVLAISNHDDGCRKGCGESLEWISEYWGPLKLNP